MTNSIKYHIHINIMMMINIKLLSIVLATTMILTMGLGTNAFAQVPALETNEEKPSLPVAPVEDQAPVKEEPAKEPEEPNTSFGKVTIPVSSGEQIILEIPLKDGNSYKLLPIK